MEKVYKLVLKTFELSVKKENHFKDLIPLPKIIRI